MNENLALEVIGVNKNYNNKFQALKNVDLKIEQGDFFALLGANGAGKSTLLSIISTLVNKDTGSVKIFDYSIDEDPFNAKSLLGVVPQELNFNGFEKVKDCLITQAGYYGLMGKKTNEYCDFLLEMLTLADKKNTQIMQLSGGMKRRLMIARALVHKPKLLLLDEPTAGVDVEIRNNMWKFIKKINKEDGVTILLTTHYLEEAENLCENLAFIDKGQIIKNATMSEVLREIPEQRFIVEVKEPLSHTPQTKINSEKLNSYTLEVKIDTNKNQTLNDFIIELDNNKIQVTSVKHKDNRLETLFNINK